MNLSKKPVSIEDLLKVKRAERPPAEFWVEFERELRAKQLAAIVAPRPWWAPFIRAGTRFSHYQIPMGAAAILALSLITVREYSSSDLDPANYTPEVTVPTLSADALEQLQVSPMASHREATAAVATELDLSAGSAVEAGADVIETGRVSHAVPLLGETPAPREPSPSELYIAANLAAAQAADPTLVDDMLGNAARRAEWREPMRDPLTQVVAPGETRRSRLLATALPAVAGEADLSMRDSTRVARRLTEDRLYDTISRVGVRGDRVAIKF